jgi:hypothetical protein
MRVPRSAGPLGSGGTGRTCPRLLPKELLPSFSRLGTLRFRQRGKHEREELLGVAFLPGCCSEMCAQPVAAYASSVGLLAPFRSVPSDSRCDAAGGANNSSHFGHRTRPATGSKSSSKCVRQSGQSTLCMATTPRAACRPRLRMGEVPVSPTERGRSTKKREGRPGRFPGRTGRSR